MKHVKLFEGFLNEAALIGSENDELVQDGSSFNEGKGYPNPHPGKAMIIVSQEDGQTMVTKDHGKSWVPLEKGENLTVFVRDYNVTGTEYSVDQIRKLPNNRGKNITYKVVDYDFSRQQKWNGKLYNK